MKYLILILTFSLSFSLNAQEKELKPNIFLRVYHLNGKKIAKGKLYSTDSSKLTLKRNKDLITISVDSIGSIKTKRSGGHNILLGSAIGAGAAILLITASGGESPNNYSSWQGIGTLIFTVGGAGVGAISAIDKKSRTFQIQGDTIQWKEFRSLISND